MSVSNEGRSLLCSVCNLLSHPFSLSCVTVQFVLIGLFSLLPISQRGEAIPRKQDPRLAKLENWAILIEQVYAF